MGQGPTSSRLKDTSFLVNNFQISLFPQKTELLIKAFEISTFKCFQTTITLNRVKEATSGIFPDLEFLYQSLQDAIKRKDPAMSISITDDGKLTYTGERIVQGKKKLEKFTIALKEEAMDDMKKLQNQVEMLLKNQMQQENRIAALEMENRKLEARVEKQDTEIEKLKNNRVPEEYKSQDIRYIKKNEKPDVFIDNKSKALANGKSGGKEIKALTSELVVEKLTFEMNWDSTKTYAFESENKTITKLNDSTWEVVFAEREYVISKPNKRRFSVKVNHTMSGFIMIGVCPVYLKNQRSINNSQDVVYYYGSSNGSIHIGGDSYSLGNARLQTGSVLAVLVDLENGVINFELDGVTIYNAGLVNTFEYLPFVELFCKNDRVTFV